MQSEIKTHIILATTRNTYYSPQIASSVGLLRLRGLKDEYIEQSIGMWLQSNGQNEEYKKLRETKLMTELVELVDGYPLAAKLAADSMSVQTPKQLLESSKQKKRFRMQFAAHILRSIKLTPLQQIILQILTTVGEPMLLEDMLSISELNKYNLEDIHDAKLALSNNFLIEQEGDVISLHNFIKAYYREELRQIQNLHDLISNEYGLYAYEKVNELVPSLDEEKKYDENQILISNNIFRYAVSAGRLLRRVGKDESVEKLCINIQGTLREMVFYFYQDKKDYKKAIEYAELWLNINYVS